jgi:tRNA pseudouridine38-40 synthase
VTKRDAQPLARVALTIAYDGTAYAGWQRQETGTGVQEKLEAALAKLYPQAPRLHSSSRTDTGVHALGLVAHFEVPRTGRHLAPRKLLLAVNAWLPEDIRVLAARRVSSDFHARFSATGKQYRYFVWNHPAMNPLWRTQAWHVPRPLDCDATRQAASALRGRHDFRAFSTNPGYARESTVRTLVRCELRKQGPLLTFLLEADGFLYRMCRGIVGTLVQAGLGRFQPRDVKRWLRNRDRRVAGMSAPAHGLVLWKVFYRRA